MKKIKQNFWRFFYASICTILQLHDYYLRGELPIPEEYGILVQIFVYCLAFPLFMIIAWFWDSRKIYNECTKEYLNPISYETYLFIGTVFLFLFAVYYIAGSFLIPIVPMGM
jgi:hypothetical protein